MKPIRMLKRLGLTAAGVAALRYWQLDRTTPNPFRYFLPMEVHAVGESYVLVRRAAGQPRLSVVCVPGFLEDVWYFRNYLIDTTVEVILVGNSDYHLPVVQAKPQVPSWAQPNPHEVGTIEYDAAVLNQALEHLVTAQRVKLHGHSRGGAVLLEAALQRLDLHEHSPRELDYVLEAPVLPLGEVHPLLAFAAKPVGLWLLPVLMPMLRRVPMRLIGPLLLGPPRGDKMDIMARLWLNPRRARTVVTNVVNLVDWMHQHRTDVYQHLRGGRIIIPAKDRILSRPFMMYSARRAKPRLQMVETRKTYHMISQDDPTVVGELTP